MLPISVIDGEGLKELVQYFEPDTLMLLRATVTECTENVLRRKMN